VDSVSLKGSANLVSVRFELRDRETVRRVVGLCLFTSQLGPWWRRQQGSRKLPNFNWRSIRNQTATV